MTSAIFLCTVLWCELIVFFISTLKTGLKFVYVIKLRKTLGRLSLNSNKPVRTITCMVLWNMWYLFKMKVHPWVNLWSKNVSLSLSKKPDVMWGINKHTHKHTQGKKSNTHATVNVCVCVCVCVCMCMFTIPRVSCQQVCRPNTGKHNYYRKRNRVGRGVCFRGGHTHKPPWQT